MDTLVDLVRESTRRHRDRDALLFKPTIRTQRYRYQDVWEVSGRIAAYLQSRGIDRGDRVLFWAPNLPEWPLALIACLRLGVVAVPLDVRSTPEFVQAIAGQTEPKLALFSRFAPNWERLSGVPTLELADLRAATSGLPADPTTPAIAPTDLAEIMFTSGTTGSPKGVMLTHRNILANVLQSKDMLPGHRHHRVLSLLPLSHMLEQTGGLFVGMLHGATVSFAVSRQPAILMRTMAERRITTMVLVPQALQLFMDAIEREVARSGRQGLWQRMQHVAAHLPFPARRLLFRSVLARFGGDLEFLACGGAYLDPVVGEKWQRMGVHVLQGYGATEASPVIALDTYREGRLDALGKVVPGLELRIAPDGEMLARGPNITPGYWNNPEATRNAFEDGWYKTGDLGTVDEHGWVFFKGRKKDLIVLANGQNVFPEDIENAIQRQPGVRDVAVVGLPQDGGQVEVHAALLLLEGADAGAVVRGANGQLASHQQVRGHTVWPYDDFPRTHTLKVKKHEVVDALKHAGAGGRLAALAAAAAEPAPAAESTSALVRLMRTLYPDKHLDLQPEATLGGDLNLDSLARVELLSAIEQELGAYVDDSAVAADTTVAGLEALAAASPRQAARSPFAAWPLHPVTQVVREVANQLVIFPLYHLLWRSRVLGREHLADLPHPALIAPNHNFGAGTVAFDPMAAWMALPRSLRLRTCIAAADDDVFGNPVAGFAVRALANGFPLSREGNVRASLEYVGRLIDLGWSVLIFPEGQLTVDGPIQPFKAGIGLLAVEAGLPVVPLRIKEELKSLVQGRWFPPRGAYTVAIGPPLTFPFGTPYSAATAEIEAAVRAL